MPKANLFVVGAPKCGTTAWWHYLNSHPQVFMCKPKEPHYFCSDFVNFCWKDGIGEYERLFECDRRVTFRGDASIMHLYSKVAAKQISRYSPSARIIIFLRETFPFLQSYHRQQVRNLDENILSLRSALDAEVQRREGLRIPSECREKAFLLYREVASFSGQVERYLEVFDPRQIMVLRLEDWKTDPKAAYVQVLKFLGLAEVIPATFDQFNAARAYRSRWLSKAYRRPPPSVLRMWRVTGKKFGLSTKSVKQALRRINEPTVKLPKSASDLETKITREFVQENSRLKKLVSELPFSYFGLDA